MEKEIEKIKKERDEYLEGWKRCKADFLNYKKEEGEKMQTFKEFIEQELLLKIFPILDNLQRAVKEIPDKGIEQILSQWQEFLKSQGIEEIESVGKPFDPEIHEAVGETEGDEPGVVAEEIEKGYMINNKVLRPTKVKIAK